MFTTPCFIRKNTPELRKRLEELGYKYGGKASNFGQPYLYCSLDKYFECNRCPARYHGIIDCGDNEELFLALVALRDDTDKYQWFIYNSMDCTVEKLRNFYWFKCEEDKIEDMMYWDCAYLNCTKATVEEIIDHFKSPICQEIGD
jgi:hypothetical protein